VSGRSLNGCLGAVISMVVSLLTATLLGKVWSACGTGVSNSVNGAFLTLIFIPVLWIALLVVWLTTGVLLREHPAVRSLAAAVLMLALSWWAILLFWESDSYSCPGGAPSWWPGFLPTP
jgi:hypothetical protein